MKRGIKAIPPELLSWVKDRCVVDEGVDGCWLWKLSLHDGAQPQGKYLGKIINVRRVLLAHMNGGEYPRALVATCRCKVNGCTRPEHLYGTTRSKVLTGMPRSLVHCANLARAARVRSPFTQEDVDAIRADARPNTEVAQALGVDDTVISQIRLHKTWRDYANPFMTLAQWRSV
jgi:hypothetical protein